MFESLICEGLIFIVLSIPIAYVSRHSLRSPNSHGFYRFFAWEAILALTLLNLRHWFKEPFSWHQLISWLMLIASGYLVFEGVMLLKKIGAQNSQRTDSPMLDFEKTTRLVTVGLYHYIRHPLYSSLLFLTWGIFFKEPAWAGVLLAGISTACLIATARAEEAENARYFGDQYQAYKQQSKMFVPYLF